MEQSFKEQDFKTSLPNTTIAIRGSDGIVIGIPKATAFNAALIHNYFRNSQDAITIPEGKECSFDNDAINFAERSVFVGLDEHDEPIRLDLRAETLGMVFKCIHDSKEIKKLTKF